VQLAQHKAKKRMGPAPADPVGGSKKITFLMKMNALEVAMAQALADKHGVSRAEMLRLLVRERYEMEIELDRALKGKKKT